MNDLAIIFRNVWKSYPSYNHITGGIKSFLFHLPQAIQELNQRRTALEGISFEIPRGSKFGFVGRNGAGKSTTLGLIAGVLSPDQGEVVVKGRVSPLLELGAGFHPEMTGRENIMLNGVLLGLTKAEVLEYQDRIIEFSELNAFIDQPVRTYSSGMFAKLGFAVVSILKPDILLLDEILAVGDEAFKRKSEAKFDEFRADPNVTMVLVSHSLDSVIRVCDQAAWIENKTVRLVGPATEVVKEYRDSIVPKIVVKEKVEVGAPLLKDSIPTSIRLPSEFSDAKAVYLLRHGWSFANEKHLINGTPAHSLTEKGKQQAHRARELANLYHLSFTHYFVSQWKRAQETADIFSPKEKFIVDARLGETNPGDAALMTFSEFTEQYPDFFPINPDRSFPNGETHRQHFIRSVDWFKDITEHSVAGSQILAVCHTGTISCILQYALGIGIDFGFPLFVPQHASLTKIVQVDKDRWKMSYFSIYLSA